MGTNYYQIVDGQERHIGKSSYGWVFFLRIYPNEGINDFQDYDFGKGYIADEYGDIIKPGEMVKIIQNRSFERGEFKSGNYTHYYKTEQEFLAKNFAEYYNDTGLLQPVIDGRYCVGHGAGTWCLKIGEFS